MSQIVDGLFRAIEEFVTGMPVRAEKLINQVPSAALPPAGNTGTGYTAAAHASTHETGGSDALALGSIAGTLTDAQHGSRAGGTLHPNVIAAGAAGFMTGTDKTKLDGIATGATANTGTVTSVALTAPSELSVVGGPITTSGTLALTWATKAANLVFSGPTSGGAATPAFRTLDPLDIPSLDAAKLTTGTLAQARGGTGVSNAGTLTNASNTTITGGGTLALGGFTLTVPATGTAALLGTAQTFTATQIVNAELDTRQLLKVRGTSGTTGYGLRFGDGTTEVGNFQALDLGGTSYIFFATNRQFDGSGWQQLNTRVGGDVQISGDLMEFYTFPTSSITGVGQFSVGVSGIVNARVGFSVLGTQVVSSRQAGWSAPTGTLTRGSFAATATLATTAQTLAALITDLRTHGLI